MATKITALPARAAVVTTDILPVVDAAAGTPATQKATVAQVRAALMPVVNADVAAGANISVSKLQAAGTNGYVLTTTAGVAGWANPTGVSAPWHNVPAVEKLISYTLLSTDYMIVFTGASGGVTFTLPATPTAGDTYVVSNQGSVSCTVAGNGNTILGVTTFTLAVNQSITLTKSTSGIWVIQ